MHIHTFDPSSSSHSKGLHRLSQMDFLFPPRYKLAPKGVTGHFPRHTIYDTIDTKTQAKTKTVSVNCLLGMPNLTSLESHLMDANHPSVHKIVDVYVNRFDTEKEGMKGISLVFEGDYTLMSTFSLSDSHVPGFPWMIKQLVQAMEFSVSRGRIRKLTEENVIISSDGSVKILHDYLEKGFLEGGSQEDVTLDEAIESIGAIALRLFGFSWQLRETVDKLKKMARHYNYKDCAERFANPTSTLYDPKPYLPVPKPYDERSGNLMRFAVRCIGYANDASTVFRDLLAHPFIRDVWSPYDTFHRVMILDKGICSLPEELSVGSRRHIEVVTVAILTRWLRRKASDAPASTPLDWFGGKEWFHKALLEGEKMLKEPVSVGDAVEAGAVETRIATAIAAAANAASVAETRVAIATADASVVISAANAATANVVAAETRIAAAIAAADNAASAAEKRVATAAANAAKTAAANAANAATSAVTSAVATSAVTSAVATATATATANATAAAVADIRAAVAAAVAEIRAAVATATATAIAEIREAANAAMVTAAARDFADDGSDITDDALADSDEVVTVAADTLGGGDSSAVKVP